MFFTIANHNEARNPKGFKNYEAEFENIPELVMSGKAYMSCKVKDEYRKNSNYDGNEDVLILDIDDGCTISQAKEIFKKYKYFIITTKSHKKDKGGLVCDRFRVFLQLDETINDMEIRTAFILEIFSLYFFVDQSCKDVRFYFSSPPNAEIFYNNGKCVCTNIYNIAKLSVLKGLEATSKCKHFKPK